MDNNMNGNETVDLLIDLSNNTDAKIDKITDRLKSFETKVETLFNDTKTSDRLKSFETKVETLFNDTDNKTSDRLKSLERKIDRSSNKLETSLKDLPDRIDEQLSSITSKLTELDGKMDEVLTCLINVYGKVTEVEKSALATEEVIVDIENKIEKIHEHVPFIEKIEGVANTLSSMRLLPGYRSSSKKLLAVK